jgi:hypothetical protein
VLPAAAFVVRTAGFCRQNRDPCWQEQRSGCEEPDFAVGSSILPSRSLRVLCAATD